MNANSIFAPVNLAEAAYLSGLSRRDIDRVIDERIVPDAMIASGGVRMINAAACALARFYFETATTLTAATRRRIVSDMSERLLAQRAATAGQRIDLKRLTFDEGVVHVDFAGFLRAVIDARKQLAGSEKLIVSDDDILGGEPVFKGTRVPVRQVAAALAAGESNQQVRDAYPAINQAMLAAAPAWARAHPARGRPPGVASAITGAKLKSRRVFKRRA
jgi:uncharacterized protein (DUF433 family)